MLCLFKKFNINIIEAEGTKLRKEFIEYFIKRISQREVVDPPAFLSDVKTFNQIISKFLYQFKVSKTVKKDTLQRYLRTDSYFNLKKSSAKRNHFISELSSIWEELGLDSFDEISNSLGV